MTITKNHFNISLTIQTKQFYIFAFLFLKFIMSFEWSLYSANKSLYIYIKFKITKKFAFILIYKSLIFSLLLFIIYFY